MVFTHPVGHVVARAPALTLKVDVPPDAAVRLNDRWYSIAEYRGNDAYDGVTYKGGVYPLWTPNRRVGLERAKGAVAWHATLMRRLLQDHTDVLDSVIDERDAQEREVSA